MTISRTPYFFSPSWTNQASICLLYHVMCSSLLTILSRSLLNFLEFINSLGCINPISFHSNWVSSVPDVGTSVTTNHSVVFYHLYFQPGNLSFIHAVSSLQFLHQTKQFCNFCCLTRTALWIFEFMENAWCILCCNWMREKKENGRKQGLYLKEHRTDLRKDPCYPRVEKIMVHLEENVFSMLTCLAQN